MNLIFCLGPNQVVVQAQVHRQDDEIETLLASDGEVNDFEGAQETTIEKPISVAESQQISDRNNVSPEDELSETSDTPENSDSDGGNSLNGDEKNAVEEGHISYRKFFFYINLILS